MVRGAQAFQGNVCKLDAQGLAPKSYYVGAKRLISDAADADWLREREAEAESTAA